MPRADAMKDSVWRTLGEKIALQKENEELKRLLRLAITSFNYIANCCTCKNANNEDDPHCMKGCFYEWQYAAEAEKLLKQRRKDELKGDE